MKKAIIFFLFVLSFVNYAQLFDNYNGSAQLAYSTDGTWAVSSNRYEGQTGSSTLPEHSYSSYNMTGSIAAWNLSNSKENEWIGWMDLNRTSVGGWGASHYSCGMVLAANAADLNESSTVGYAIGFNSDGTLVLFRFSSGISSGSSSLPSGSTEIVSTTYTYDDGDNGINFYVKLETDGKWTVKWKSGTQLSESDAVDPSKYSDGSVTSSSADDSYRGTSYSYVGWIYAHSSGASEKAYFDNLGFSQEGALPVELTSFTSKIIGNTVNLKWNTATEVENYGFDIQRSVVGGQRSSDWEKIGFVHGHGNSNSPKEYSFVDNISSPNGKYFYRLKQIDNDGSYDFSGIVEADFGLPNKFELKQNYPNPFNPSTEIGFALAKEGKVTLNVYNVLGVKVATLLNNEYREAGYHTLQFTTQSYQLPSGIYYYKLESSGNVQVRKMILQK